jgi:ribosomal protein L37AE/L43A
VGILKNNDAFIMSQPICWACGETMEEKVEDIWTCPFCESIFTLGMSLELIEEKMGKEIRARERGMISGHGGGDKRGKKSKKKSPISYPRVDINPFSRGQKS